MVTKKLTAIWRIITAKDFFLASSTRRDRLERAVLMSVQIKNGYDGFIQRVNELAAEAGELHRLQALRAAVDDKLEKENVGD